MRVRQNQDEQSVLAAVVEALRPIEKGARQRILKSVGVFYDVPPPGTEGPAMPRQSAPSHSVSAAHSPTREPNFSGHPEMSPKQFLEEKQPRSDVERVACLGYYLAHYRDTPHFKTIDISRLNTEAAQFKFSNAAVAVNNAALRGLLTSATKGNKQISALGEHFVDALPSRDAAKAILERLRVRRRRRSRPIGRKTGRKSDK